VLCELLPVAVPSLVLSLLAAREEEPLLAAPWLVPEAHAPALLERWRRRLRCPPGPRAWPALQQSASHWELGNCSFLVAQCERALEAAASVLQRPASSSSAHWAPWNFLKAERGAPPPPPPSPPLRRAKPGRWARVARRSPALPRLRCTPGGARGARAPPAGALPGRGGVRGGDGGGACPPVARGRRPTAGAAAPLVATGRVDARGGKSGLQVCHGMKLRRSLDVPL
ncbi:Protein of unknown function, partial [Gryllus bimaculatus]